MAKEKILIVDDESMSRWTLNEALRGWDYDTVEAGTVADALASFTTASPSSRSTCRRCASAAMTC